MADPMDFQKMMQDAAASMNMDPERLKEMFRTQAGYGEKLSQAALSAAEKSAELSASFARETLARLGEVSKVREAPADYGQAMQDFASAQSALMQNQVAAFAEIAKALQSDTMQVMMGAAQEAQAKGAEAMKTAGATMTPPGRKK